jgi:ABC-2 type transport system permease protein
MIAALRSEWIKFSTVTSTWVLLGLAVAFPLVIVIVTGIVADGPADGGELAGAIVGTGVVSSLLLGTLGILSITAELSTNTIRPTFAAMPDRWRPLLAKPILHVALTAVAMTTIVVVGWLAGSALIRGEQSLDDDSAGGMLLGIVVLAMLLMLFGYALGLAVRSTPLAICILLLWPLVVEGIIAGLLAVANREELQRWLPYQAGFELISGDDSINGDSLGPVGGGLWFGFWIALLLGFGLWRTHRRDA